MNKTLFGIVALVALLLAGISVTMQVINKKKIVYVNSSKLLDQYAGMTDARAQFQEKTKDWQVELDTMYSHLTKRIQAYEKNVSRMSTAEAKKEKGKIEHNSAQLEKHRHAVNEKAKEEDERITMEVVKEVNTFITEYCKKKKYRIVLGITQGGNLVYAEESIDITDELIVEINRSYRGKK